MAASSSSFASRSLTCSAWGSPYGIATPRCIRHSNVSAQADAMFRCAIAGAHLQLNKAQTGPMTAFQLTSQQSSFTQYPEGKCYR